VAEVLALLAEVAAAAALAAAASASTCTSSASCFTSKASLDESATASPAPPAPLYIDIESPDLFNATQRIELKKPSPFLRRADYYFD
jgi:hypothetical protein